MIQETKLDKHQHAMVTAAVQAAELHGVDREQFVADVHDELKSIGKPTTNQVRAAVTAALAR